MALFHLIKTELLTRHARFQSSMSDLSYTSGLSSYPVFLNHPFQPHGSSCLLNIPGTCYLKVFTRAIFFLSVWTSFSADTFPDICLVQILASISPSQWSLHWHLSIFIYPPIHHFCIFYIPEVTWIYSSPPHPYGTYHFQQYYIPYYMFFIILTFIVSLCPVPAPFPQI